MPSNDGASTSASPPRQEFEKLEEYEGGNVVHDAIAGFTGGAIGILAANPLDLLKVRQQVAPTHGPLPAPNPSSTHSKTAPPMPPGEGIFRGLRTLYRTEGWRVFFAGTLAPVATYAGIDAVYFSVWGGTMDWGRQNREDPSSLATSAIGGAAAGAVCAFLQTPVEVIKVRAQIERQTAGRKGSKGIVKHVLQSEGIKGFAVGFWPTFWRDAFANAAFFPLYHACRRLVRGEHPLLTREEAQARRDRGDTSIFRIAGPSEFGSLTAAELARAAVAGGVAGAASMIVTYPLDVIKTQAQQSVKAGASGERVDMSMRGLYRRIAEEGRLAAERDPTFRSRNWLSQALIRNAGFFRGFRLGVATAALQAGTILPIFECLTALLARRGS